MKNLKLAVLGLTFVFTLSFPVTLYATEAEGEITIIDESDWEIDESEEETPEEEETAEPEQPAQEPQTDTNTDTAASNSSTGTSQTSSGSSSTTAGTSSSTRSNSSDSSLKRLSIDPGELSPAFSPDIFSYTAYVDADVTSISVGANPNDPGGVIASVSGAKSISVGENTVKVVVEAPNRSTSEYIITVYCGTEAPQEPAETDGRDVEDTETPQTQTPETDDASGTDTPVPITFDTPEVEIDADGTLYYDGRAYVEEGTNDKYTEKYNALYEKYQREKNKFIGAVVVGVIVIAILLILLVNLMLRQKLDEPETVKVPKPAKPAKTEKKERQEKSKTEKPRAEKPKQEKPRQEKASAAPKVGKKKAEEAGLTDEEMEIMDLNDL